MPPRIPSLTRYLQKPFHTRFQSSSARTKVKDPTPAPYGPKTSNMGERYEALVPAVNAASKGRRGTIEELQAREYAGRVERMNQRRWRDGDVYTPKDMGVRSARQANSRRGREQAPDPLDRLGLDPKNCYYNFAMMSEYVSEMGRIYHPRTTGLRPVNQRRMAKAVRRAIGLGLMPSVHRHPMMLPDFVDLRNQYVPDSNTRVSKRYI